MRIKPLLVTALLLGISLPAVAQLPDAQPTMAQAQTQPVPATPPAGGPAPAETIRTTPPSRVAQPLPANVPTVDIFALIDRLAVEMDREFILDPRMVGLIGLSTAGEEADYDSLLALLRANSYAAIEVGDEIRIVTEATARSEPSLVLNEDDSRVSDHAIVTRVIDLGDIETGIDGAPVGLAAVQLVPVLRPLMSTAVGNASAVPGTNTLIIVDRYDNVRRITAIVDEMRQ